MFGEIALALQPGSESKIALSPLATCCWSDEDYIGRVSRVSRSVHGATVAIATMRKALGFYKTQLERHAPKVD